MLNPFMVLYKNGQVLQQAKKIPPGSSRGGMWKHLESNQGHTDFQSVALPTELWLHLFQAVANVRKIIFSQNFYVEFLFI